MKKNGWKIMGIIIFIISIIFLCFGFDKLINMDAYQNSYVGGDAYNYIINSSKATAYFVLSSFFLILSIGCGIFYYFTNLSVEENLSHNTFNDKEWICPNCGTKNVYAPNKEEEPKKSVVKKEIQILENGDWKCPSCGAKNPANDKRCYCGFKRE